MFGNRNQNFHLLRPDQLYQKAAGLNGWLAERRSDMWGIFGQTAKIKDLPEDQQGVLRYVKQAWEAKYGEKTPDALHRPGIREDSLGFYQGFEE